MGVSCNRVKLKVTLLVPQLLPICQPAILGLGSKAPAGQLEQRGTGVSSSTKNVCSSYPHFYYGPCPKAGHGHGATLYRGISYLNNRQEQTCLQRSSRVAEYERYLDILEWAW